MRKLTTHLIFVLLIVYSCKNDDPKPKENFEKVRCTESELQDSISNTLLMLNLKGLATINENGEDAIFLRIDYSASNQNISESPFFYDLNSDTIITNIILTEFYAYFLNYDSITILNTFEGYDEVSLIQYSNGDLLEVFENYLKNPVKFQLDAYMVSIGYDDMIIYDLAYKKNGENYKSSSIYDLFDKLDTHNELNNSIGNSYLDFLFTIMIATDGYPNLTEHSLELYNIVGVNSDSIIMSGQYAFEYVHENIDSSLERPW